MIPEIETKSKQEIKQLQEQKLADLLIYVNSKSKFYKKLFQNNNIDLSQINTLEDLPKIPVTTKNNLQQHFQNFLCVENQKVIDFVTTSGTMGNPVTFGMTDKDLDRLAYNEYLSFSCANTTSVDIFQLMVTLDKRFMAGMAYFLGIRKLGAGIIRVGPGSPELQFESINRYKPTGLITVPSFIPKLIEYAEKNGIDYKNSSIKKAVCIGEPIRTSNFKLNRLGKKIKEKWDIELFSTYASTEMGTAFTECKEGKGGHHHPDMIIVEFLDDNNMPVADNEMGEVTITTLGVEGMPLLRFKTGDICYHYTEKCKCGRTTMRLGPVIGRKQQMIKFKGTTLYPPAIFDVLNEINCVENYIVEVSTNSLGTDDVIIKVGCDNPAKNITKKLKDNFRAKLRVAPEFEFYSQKEIHKMQYPEHVRKPINFVDKR